MLACLDSSSVTVRNNEIFIKEIQDEYRNGDESPVFTMCRELENLVVALPSTL